MRSQCVLRATRVVLPLLNRLTTIERLTTFDCKTQKDRVLLNFFELKAPIPD